MSLKGVSKRVASLSPRFWQEALKIEKLHDLVDDLHAAFENVEPLRSSPTERQIALAKEISEKFRQLSWDLAKLDDTIQELAWKADELQDLIEELSPV